MKAPVTEAPLRCKRLICPGLGLVVAMLLSAGSNAVEKKDAKPAAKVSYYHEIRPILQANCQGCHGPSGRASVVGKAMGARNFQDPAVLKVPVAMLAKIIANGKNQMPPYQGTLTAKEIKDLAKYVKDMK